VHPGSNVCDQLALGSRLVIGTDGFLFKKPSDELETNTAMLMLPYQDAAPHSNDRAEAPTKGRAARAPFSHLGRAARRRGPKAER
jgi:hypothetical protein